MDEKLEKNLNIYFQCINKSYQNDDITPLLELLYDLVDKFDDDIMTYNSMMSNNDLVRINKSEFIEKAIKLLTKIVKDNRFNDLDKYMEIIKICELSYASIDYLYIMSYPKESYMESPKDYFDIFRRFTFKFLYVPEKLDTNVLIGNLLTVYKDYVRMFPVRNQHEIDKRNFFQGYGSCMLADFYANEYQDISINDLFDYLYNNIDELREFAALNNDGSIEADKHILDKIKRNKIQEKKLK